MSTRRRIMMQMQMPYPYRRIKWIKSDGNQYLDTEILVDSNDIKYKWKFNVMVIERDASLFGSYGSVSTFPLSGAHFFSIGLNRFYVAIAQSDARCATYNPIGIIEGETTIKDGEISLKINNRTINDTYIGVPYPSLSIHIFGDNNRGANNWERTKNTAMYYWEYYKEGKLVSRILPCINTITNEVGAYDIKRRMFLKNKGTGVFQYAL